MPGPLEHSPADVLRSALVDLGLGSTPTNPPGDWPVYVDSRPDRPDAAIVITDTAGQNQARVFQGERAELYGVQILVTGATAAVAYPKAQDIATALDTGIKLLWVSIGLSAYLINSVVRSPGPVLRLGKGKPGDSLSRYVINALVNLEQPANGGLVLESGDGFLLLE